MIALIKNEIIKLFSRKKTWVVFILFSLLLGVMIFAEYKEAESSARYNSPEYQLQNEEQNIEYMEQRLEAKDVSDSEKTRLEESIEESKVRIVSLNEEINGEPIDWKEKLKQTNKDIEAEIEMYKENPDIDISMIQGMETQLEMNNYMLDNDIEPVEYYELNTNKYFQDIIMFLGAIFLAIGLSIFSADIVSGEFTPATVKVLLTQPVKKGKVILSKFIAIALSSIVLVMVAEAISFVVTGIVAGFGSLNYPIMVGYKYEFVKSATSATDKIFQMIQGSVKIIPMWQYLLNVTLLQVLFIVAAVAFVFMISTIFRNSTISMGFSILIIIVTTILQNFAFIRKYIPYTFIGLGDVGSLYIGTLASAYENPIITPTFGIVVLLVWTIVCYLVSHIIFVKRDAF
ncbi:ABC transporter permease subunit [Clostridium sp. DL1XJH146]